MTTTWRYVVTRERRDDEDVYAVRQLYVDSETGALSWSKEPIAPQGDTWVNLFDDLSRMGDAFAGAVLDLTLDPPELVSRFPRPGS